MVPLLNSLPTRNLLSAVVNIVQICVITDKSCVVSETNLLLKYGLSVLHLFDVRTLKNSHPQHVCVC
jgi:hypothetical protein